MIIRLGQISDFDQVMALSQMLDEVEGDYKEKLELALVSALVWVAEDDGKIIGYIICELFGSDHDQLPNSVFISGLYVLEDYRRQGIARELVDKAISQKYSADYSYFSLSHDPVEEYLTKFYESCGFQVIGKTKAGNVKMIKKC